MNVDEFISLYYSKKPETIKTFIKSRYSLYEKYYIENKNKPELTKEQLNSFMEVGRNAISLTAFKMTKRFLIEMYKYLGGENLVFYVNLEDLTYEDFMQETKFFNFYFKSLESLIDEIDLFAPMDKPDVMFCPFIKAICVLLWHGFTFVDISKIKTGHINIEKCKIMKPDDPDLIIDIDKKYIKYINDCIICNEYYSFSGRKLVRPVDSDYLIRTGIKESITVERLKNIIADINKTEAIKTKISAQAISQVGRFERAKRRLEKGEDKEIVFKQEFSYSNEKRNGMITLYQTWLKIYYHN